MAVFSDKANHTNERVTKFYWRYGNAPSINAKKIMKDWSKHHRRVAGKAVTKFDLTADAKNNTYFTVTKAI